MDLGWDLNDDLNYGVLIFEWVICNIDFLVVM